jgi:hypothetical protein
MLRRKAGDATKPAEHCHILFHYNSVREAGRGSCLRRDPDLASDPNGIKLSEIMDGFGWPISMGQVAHFVPWASKEMEVFRAPFFRPRFASSGSMGKSVQGDESQHVGDEKRLFAGVAGAGVDHFAPLPESIECSFATEAS